MNNGLTFGDYFVDKRLEKMKNHFIFKVDRLVNWIKGNSLPNHLNSTLNFLILI